MHLHHRLPGAALALLLAVSAAAQNPSPAARILPFDASERTLANGLKVIVVPTGFPNIVSLQIPVQTGSRNEVEPGKSGFAHFFEHMMFRGTKAYPPDAYQAVVTKAGARQNAFTSDDFTNYHTTFAKEDLETILKIEADRFQNLDYPLEGFKTESRAVLGEYNKNSANPIQKLIEVQRENAFKAHTYRHTTMGFLKDIEDMPNQFEYSKTFFDRWYRPEYATVIVAGDVKADEVFPLVEKYWGSWKTGSYKVDVPAEPPPAGPIVAHVPWTAPTLPWVSVAFRTPAFSEDKPRVGGARRAVGPRLRSHLGALQEPGGGGAEGGPAGCLLPAEPRPLPDDDLRARQEGRGHALRPRPDPEDARRGASRGAPGAAREGRQGQQPLLGCCARSTTPSRSPRPRARYVRYHRSFDTINELYRTYDAVTPDDILAAAKRYVVDAGLVQTTLAKDPLPEAIAKLASVTSLPVAAPAPLLGRRCRPPRPRRPPRKPARPSASSRWPSARSCRSSTSSCCSASARPTTRRARKASRRSPPLMIADAGSRSMTIAEIKQALFPMAASFDAQVDKELTTFTARVHRDNWARFAEIALPQLAEPGFREEDFRRLKDQQKNALVEDLRTNNEEELGKERLQALVFQGTPYGHPVLGSVAGLEAITLDDVRDFVKKAYTRAALRVGLAGDLPAGLEPRLGQALAQLPEGPALAAPTDVVGKAPQGLSVEIIEKETRATAISFGHPIAVNRSHPDYPALYLARTWLGEHRASTSHLYQRIREARGMNYGDYAYIEAFPRGMFQFFPDPNLARRAQLFEVWIRPVVPENGPMALRIALHELRQLIDTGLTQADFESTRDYLMKNVFVMTATQNQQLGYALDSEWYRIPEFTGYMRDKLAKLTLADVNAAIRKHLSGSEPAGGDDHQGREGPRRDAARRHAVDHPLRLAQAASLADEDKAIGALKLGLQKDKVVITPVGEVFAR